MGYGLGVRLSCEGGRHKYHDEFGPLQNSPLTQGYQPLRQPSRQLRLVILEPTFARIGDDDKVPQLEVVTIDTRCEECGKDYRTPYCALSYACGDPSITRPVLVDGQLRSVTSNLRAFLEQSAFDLQSFNNNTRATGALTKQYWIGRSQQDDPDDRASKIIVSAVYWIDSICINQIDNVEKSHQITHMGFIYGNATRVVAWLGPHQDQSDLAVHLLSELGHQVKLAEADPTTCYHVSYIPTRATRHRICSLREDRHPWRKAIQQIQQSRGNRVIPNRETTSALKALCDRSYWTRAWVIREVAFAYDDAVTLMCGHLTLDACDLDSGLQEWSKKQHTNPDKLAPSLLFHRATSHIGIRTTLADLLMEVARDGKVLASLPHDYIYSLLPLAEDEFSCGIWPDYNVTVRDLYVHVASYLFDHVGQSILRMCRLDLATGPIVNLPSWVPNWALLGSTTTLLATCCRRGMTTDGRFTCGGQSIFAEATLNFPACT